MILLSANPGREPGTSPGLCFGGAGECGYGVFQSREHQEEWLHSGGLEQLQHAIIDPTQCDVLRGLVASDVGADQRSEPRGIDIRNVAEVQNHHRNIFFPPDRVLK